MKTLAAFDRQLEQFRIENRHGDRTENDLWAVVADDFPNYERFWRLYITPLTRRIEPNRTGPHWIRIRPEAKRFEQMAMRHYSTFTYFAHATKRLKTADTYELLANIVLFLLDTSIDNLEAFFKEIEAFHRDCGVKISFGQPRQENKYLKQIADYRNVLAHNPVLGRAVDKGLENLPVPGVLDRIKLSWLEAEKLREDELRETKGLLEELRAGYGAYLNAKWGDVLAVMAKKRAKYMSLLSISHTDIIVPTTTTDFSVSGSFRSDVNPMASMSRSHSGFGDGVFNDPRKDAGK